MTEPDVDGVRLANERFYRAFESLDPAEMDEVWPPEGLVTCVHPGWPLIAGRDAVMDSWARIFQNTTMMQFTLTGLEVSVEGGLGWVVCTENLTSVVDGRVREGRVQATNIYARRDGTWYVVHHQGGPTA